MEKTNYFINLTFNCDTYDVGDDFSAEIYNPHYNTEYLSEILAYDLNYNIGYSYYFEGYISKNKFYVEKAIVSNADEHDAGVTLNKTQFKELAKTLIDNKVIVNKITKKEKGDMSKINHKHLVKEAEEAGRIFGIDISNAPGRFENEDVKEFTYLALKYVYEKSQFGYGSDPESKLKRSFIDGIQKFIDECA